MNNNDIVNEIVQAEEALRVAMVCSDVDSLDKLISPKLMFTNHFGMSITKEADLLMHKSGELNIDTISLSDMAIEVLDNLVAVAVKAKIVSVFQGEQRNTSFRFTRIWGKENGNWVVVVGHSCIVT